VFECGPDRGNDRHVVCPGLTVRVPAVGRRFDAPVRVAIQGLAADDSRAAGSPPANGRRISLSSRPQGEPPKTAAQALQPCMDCGFFIRITPMDRNRGSDPQVDRPGAAVRVPPASRRLDVPVQVHGRRFW
jgi:hypothetical protein